MNERVKKLWIEALRGGEYRQGKRVLRSDGRFCCLGVLCDLYNKREGRGEWRGDSYFYDDYGDFSEVQLPDAVVEWAELPDRDPRLGTHKNAVTAAVLNDRGETFKYIADRIEKYL